MKRAEITPKMRANMARVRPQLTADEYNDMVLDAEALITEMRSIDDEIFAARRPGNMANDAVPAGILPRMLEVVLAQAEREREVVYEWRGLFPIDRYDWRAKTVYIPVWSSEGMAAWYYGGGNHPNVAAGLRMVPITMRTESVSYTVDWFEAQLESFAGIQSEVEKVNACYRALDRFAGDVIYSGSAEAGFAAFIGHPNIAAGALPYGDWDSTPVAEEVLADCTYAIDRVFALNDGVEGFVERKVSLWLSPTMHRLLNSLRVDTVTQDTVMTVLMKDTRLREVRAVTFLGATAGGANDYIIAGVFDQTEIAVPMGADADRMPPTEGGHFMTQPLFTTLGGIQVKRPLSFWRGTGILA